MLLGIFPTAHIVCQKYCVILVKNQTCLDSQTLENSDMLTWPLENSYMFGGFGLIQARLGLSNVAPSGSCYEYPWAKGGL
jgi:hypothetical protein